MIGDAVLPPVRASVYLTEGSDVMIDATVQKRSRNTAFCEVSLLMAHTGAIAAHSTATWAILEG